MLQKEKKHEQFPPYSLYRPLQGGLRKSRVLNHPVGLKSSRENLELRFRPRENVDVFRVRSAPDALLHALWKERSTLSSVSGLNLHLHVFKKKTFGTSFISARIHSITFRLWSEKSDPALIAFVLPAIYPSPSSSSDSLLPPYGRFKKIVLFFYKVEGVHDQVYGGCLWFRVVVCPRCFLRALETASGFYARVAHSQI